MKKQDKKEEKRKAGEYYRKMNYLWENYDRLPKGTNRQFVSAAFETFGEVIEGFVMPDRGEDRFPKTQREFDGMIAGGIGAGLSALGTLAAGGYVIAKVLERYIN